MKFIYNCISLFALITFFSSCKDEVNPEENKVVDDNDCRTEVVEKYTSCVEAPDINTLNIATWNIEYFPQKEETSLNAVKDIINSFQADIIAVQEIADVVQFEQLLEELSGWEGQYIKDGNLSLGFIYNTCEIVSVSDAKALEIGSSSPFPRLPVEITISHQNGTDVTLINLHLKCCDDGEERREEASILLKDYIDQEYPNDNVVLLGDFNDDLLEGSPFQNFIDDSENYQFSDMEIAQGPEENYSYPSWPSHIDHILVSNELFENIVDVKVMALNECYLGYYGVVSDHRPVILSLEDDQ